MSMKYSCRNDMRNEEDFINRSDSLIQNWMVSHRYILHFQNFLWKMLLSNHSNSNWRLLSALKRHNNNRLLFLFYSLCTLYNCFVICWVVTYNTLLAISAPYTYSHSMKQQVAVIVIVLFQCANRYFTHAALNINHEMRTNNATTKCKNNCCNYQSANLILTFEFGQNDLKLASANRFLIILMLLKLNQEFIILINDYFHDRCL